MEEEQYLERDPIDQESHEIAFLDKHFEQNKSQENKKRKASKPKNNKECKQQKLPSATEDDDNEESDGIIFKLKKWNQVMIWSWDVNEDTCAICNISIIDSCPRCLDSETCPYATGQCGHSFHLCCIQRWNNKKQTCPLCSNEWIYISIGA